MTIRQEMQKDYDEVYELVKVSFATSSHSDGTTPDYLNQVRMRNTFIPELSLVTENDIGKVIGQIVLYEMNIISTEAKIKELLLSPICVHPDYFHRGIARAMIKEAFSIAKKLGYKAVFLCGNPELYKKFGFIPSFKYNIFHISDTSKEAEWCMAYELIKDSLKGITGTIDIV